MDEKKSNFFTNLITYAYKGFFATIYFLIGKKDKISEMFMLDDVNSINMDTNDVFKDNEYAEFVGSYVIDDEIDDDLIINEINGRIPDVLVCICESPVQEKWIIANKSKIGVKLILAFSGEKKEFMQKKETGIKFLAKMFARQRIFSFIL